MSHSERFSKIVDASRARIKEVNVQDVKQMQDEGASFALVDTREQSEWAQARIPGAIYLGKGVIERDVEASIPDLNAEIILYCGGGFRSALAADALQQMGYTNVASMDGGIRDWSQSGYPLER
jgi:rhodanese-related sulfurtransferase